MSTLNMKSVLKGCTLVFFGCLSYQVIGAPTNPGQTACNGNGFPTKQICMAAGAIQCSYCGGHNHCWIPGGGGNCCPGESQAGKGTCWNPTNILTPFGETRVCVSNHFSKTDNLGYAKVGVNGGGLSSGIRNGDTRCWNSAKQLTIYECNSAIDGALCYYAATITVKSTAQSVETIKVTGACGPNSSTSLATVYLTPGLNAAHLSGSMTCPETLGPNLPY